MTRREMLVLLGLVGLPGSMGCGQQADSKPKLQRQFPAPRRRPGGPAPKGSGVSDRGSGASSR